MVFENSCGCDTITAKPYLSNPSSVSDNVSSCETPTNTLFSGSNVPVVPISGNLYNSSFFNGNGGESPCSILALICVNPLSTRICFVSSLNLFCGGTKTFGVIFNLSSILCTDCFNLISCSSFENSVNGVFPIP